MKIFLVRCAGALLALSLSFTLPRSAWGQAASGSAAVAGTVTDRTGAVIPGAQVTLTDAQRGVERRTQSGASGRFVFPDITPGVYDLRVQSEGFDTSDVTGLRVEVGQRAVVNVELEVGQVGTVITVEAGAVQLATESNAIGTVVDRERVDELPLNGRNFLQLALLAGGTNQATGRADPAGQTGHPGRSVVIGGVKAAYNSYMINGIQVRGARLGELAVNLSPANVDQFKVQQSFFMPDQGPNPNIVSVTTRGGTNAVHGQAFWFLRNTELDARNFFAPGPEELKRNQFGFAAGGPIVRNKLFFYGGYEGLRQRQGFVQGLFTPTAAMFQGRFQEAQPIYDPESFNGSGRDPFANNVIPESRINASSRQLLQYYTPGSSLAQRPNNLLVHPRDVLDDDQFNFRLDWQAGDNLSVFGQFINSNGDRIDPGPFPLSGAFFPNELQLGMVQHTWTISPSIVNTFRFGASRNVALFSNEGREMGDLLTPLGIRNTFDVRGITAQGITGYAGFGRANGDLGNFDNNYQLDQGMNWITGSHQVAFGTSIRYRRTWQQNANAGAHGNLNYQEFYTSRLTTDASGQFVPVNGTGDSFAEFLLGMPVQGATRGLPLLPYRFTQYMPYIQDTWKVRRNLTVNWGLSWFKDTIPNPQGFARDLPHGFDVETGLLTFAVLGEVDPKVIQPDNNNFAPRLGFAWQLGKDTVVRAGAGVYYSDQQLIELQFASVGPPFTRGIELITDRFNPRPEFVLGQNIFPQVPLPEIDQNFARNLPPGEAPFLLNEEGPTPYVSQWNFSIQHALTRNDLLEFTYLGNSAHRQQNRYDFNQCPLAADLSCNRALRSYPQYASLLRADFNGNSSYNAVVAKYHHRMSGGLDFRAEYTWGKALTDSWESGGATNAQITECRNCDKDHASFDTRHRAVISALWEVPFGRNRKFGQNMHPVANAFAGGWTLTAITTFQTGVPLFIAAPNRTGSPFITHRPNRTCSGVLDSPNLRADKRWFDQSCFALPPVGFFGNSSRSPIHGPGINNWDIGIQKFFPIREEVRMQFRAEMFNAFNRAQFNDPVANIANPNFGLVNSARPPRLVQLALRLIF